MNILHIPMIKITSIINNDSMSIFTMLIILTFAGLSAFLMALYASNKYKTEKNITVIWFTVISIILTLLSLCYFGLSLFTIKGIVLSHIFILSSYEDIQKRECDDYIHVMIIIAGFIGTEISALPPMFFSALFVFLIMTGTVFITRSFIGGADIKMATACAFFLGFRRGILGLVLGLVLAVIINLLNNRKNRITGFPMIPYLAVGFMTAIYI